MLVEAPSELATRLDAALTAVGAVDIRYASSPADLLRRLPVPRQSGIGVLCRTPRVAVPALAASLRQRGWRRLVFACYDTGEEMARMAIAAKVRALVRRDDPYLAAVPRAAPDAVRTLTTRELQVLQAVADGCTNNEVGRRLGLSGLTVKSHLSRIGRKTGTGDRAAMVAVAMRAGLVA